MASLPRRLIALLVATLAGFGLWYVELKPSSSSGGGAQGAGTYQSAINQAHQAVKTSNAANARLGASTSTRPAASSPTPATTATKAADTTKAATSAKPATLFYNDAASDDQAMNRELRALPTHDGRDAKLAVPLSELTSFAMITQQVPVVTAPTLVAIDASRQAMTITGFADPLEITEHVDDALAAK
jgi:hypothetical protein